MLQKNWSELIKPTKMEVNVEESNGRIGKLIAEPLERGFGLTLGNSIRRILLSSLQGAAITSVKIKGVLHEFSTISGIKDDMSDIIQNLKGVRFKLSDSDVDNVKIKLKGKKIKLDPFDLIRGKKIIGSWGGGFDYEKNCMKIFKIFKKIKNFDKIFQEKSYNFNQINYAIKDLKNGKVLRPLIKL